MAAQGSLRIDYIPLGKLERWPRNPKKHALAEIGTSVDRFGFTAPLMIDERSGRLVAGHGRLDTLLAMKKEGKEPPGRIARRGRDWLVPVIRGIRFASDEDAQAYLLADNRLVELGGWDEQALGKMLGDLAVAGRSAVGWSEAEIQDLIRRVDSGTAEATGGVSLEQQQAAVRKLSERFLVPPFSVLDARQGYWQDRKRTWLSLGIQSEIGRGENLLHMSDTVLEPDPVKRAAMQAARAVATAERPNPDLPEAVQKRLGFYRANGAVIERARGSTGTSIFDPVLCELAYRWFCPPAGQVLDPFAGGSVRGIVAGLLGRRYLGIDLREEQAEANREQAAVIFAQAARAPEPAPAAPEEATFSDTAQLSPIQTVEVAGGIIWVKRDDLFAIGGARGGKARACWALLQGAKGAVTAGNRFSPMVSRVARVAEALGLPCIAHVAGSKDFSDEERDAAAHGATIVKHKVNYLTALKSKAAADAKERGWVAIPFGLECKEYFEATKAQTKNIPEGAKRIVVTTGSGMTLAAILAGLAEQGRKLSVLGVIVGSDPVPLIDRWAPKGWRKHCKLVKAPVDFKVAAKETKRWGIDLDGHYEAKTADYVQPGDLFWDIAIRATVADKPVGSVMPAWQKGFAAEELCSITRVFREYDKQFVLGAFTGVKEANVADWLHEGALRVLGIDGVPSAAAVVAAAKAKGKVHDFAGAEIGVVEPGDVQIKRLAARSGNEGLLRVLLDALAPQDKQVWLEIWQESPSARAAAAAAGFRWIGSKIRASSEIIGVWTRGARVQAREVPAVEQAALCRLDLRLDVRSLAEALAGGRLKWADHYSSYNKGHSWSALALRGYGGKADFIIKPAEMSKQWKVEHRDGEMKWALEDSPLRAELPEAEALIKAVPGVKHRIRLMRLRPGDGELTRHADITDPDAGVAPGRLLRIHVPIITNVAVKFDQWLIDGKRVQAHMAAGEAWYLDTRKPHTAVNFGHSERIHLVMDVQSCPELTRLLLHQAAPIEEAPARVAPDVEGYGWIQFEQQPAGAGGVPVAAGPAPPIEPEWAVGDSIALPELAAGKEFDLVFSCPPYGDLERYSDDPRDLSTMEHRDFLAAYRQIIAHAVGLLRPNRFACVVVGDIRDAKGMYRNFVSDTIAVFQDAGARLYNEAILVTAVGSLALRAGKIFESGRKLGKTHQQLLVFVKGDPHEAVAVCGPVEVPDLSPWDQGEDGAPLP